MQEYCPSLLQDMPGGCGLQLKILLRIIIMSALTFQTLGFYFLAAGLMLKLVILTQHLTTVWALEHPATCM